MAAMNRRSEREGRPRRSGWGAGGCLGEGGGELIPPFFALCSSLPLLLLSPTLFALLVELWAYRNPTNMAAVAAGLNCCFEEEAGSESTGLMGAVSMMAVGHDRTMKMAMVDNAVAAAENSMMPSEILAEEGTAARSGRLEERAWGSPAACFFQR